MEDFDNSKHNLEMQEANIIKSDDNNLDTFKKGFVKFLIQYIICYLLVFLIDNYYSNKYFSSTLAKICFSLSVIAHVFIFFIYIIIYLNWVLYFINHLMILFTVFQVFIISFGRNFFQTGFLHFFLLYLFFFSITYYLLHIFYYNSMLGKTELIQNLVFSGIWMILLILIILIFKNKFSFKFNIGNIIHMFFYTIALPFNYQLYKNNCNESKDYDDALGVYYYWIVFLGNKVYYTFHK
jgi:hypothetical protein